MRAQRVIQAIDSHTEGMPTRVVTGGIGLIPGATMLERRNYFEAEMDHLRAFLMHEPRGHSAMSGAILQPPTSPETDWGVLFIEVSGCLAMCGHGTIGVATVLVETGMVPVSEPETVVQLDTPAGTVTARVAVEDGRARSVTIRNVPAFLDRRDAVVEVPSVGQVRYDLAFGGNFYALVPAERLGVAVDRTNAAELIDAGLAIMQAIEEQSLPVHPIEPAIHGCKHVVLWEPGREGAEARAATAIHPGWLDRSPCGTGTSARLAQLHALGELDMGEPFINESVLGTRFTGRVVETATVAGQVAIVPEITGRAWVTGFGSYILTDDDPFPGGFSL